MINVVIADDQTLFRQGISKLINDISHIEVLQEVEDGQELVQFLEKTTQLPDVILMDLNMPRLNGIDATAQIHQQYPDIKIIVLSVYDEEQFIVRMIEQGADGYLLKNAGIDEVEKAINDVMANGFHFNDMMIEAMRKGALVKDKKLSFDRVVHLSKREEEVLKLICQEMTTTEIAETLYISTRTVDGHRQNLLDKTGARNTAGLVLYAIKHKVLDLGF
ncbi:MAG: response regulator transcription factor [Flavipsychrobacter sp.]